MEEKHPKIYQNPIEKLKTKIQNEYYYHAKSNEENKRRLSKDELILKINNLFSSSNYVYQVDTNIMFKNGENKRKKVIALQNDYLITIDNEKILLDDIEDIN